MFFSLDGIDGVGKSTQMRLFCEWLTQQGARRPDLPRPAGSTPLGDQVRNILLKQRRKHPDLPAHPRCSSTWPPVPS